MTDTDEWPEELELLSQLRESGWTLWAFGDRKQPTAIAAVQRAGTTTDVIVIRGHDLVTAYRTPVIPGGDPLRADTVIWHHTGSALDILRQALRGTPGIGGAQPYQAPAECRLPELDRRPITIVAPLSANSSD